MDCEGMTNTKAELTLYKTCQFSSAGRDCERLRPRLSSPPREHELSPCEVLPGPVVEVEQGGVVEGPIRVLVDVDEGVIGGGVMLAPVDGGKKERFSEENGIFVLIIFLRWVCQIGHYVTNFQSVEIFTKIFEAQRKITET